MLPNSDRHLHKRTQILHVGIIQYRLTNTPYSIKYKPYTHRLDWRINPAASEHCPIQMKPKPLLQPIISMR